MLIGQIELAGATCCSLELSDSLRLLLIVVVEHGKLNRTAGAFVTAQMLKIVTRCMQNTQKV